MLGFLKILRTKKSVQTLLNVVPHKNGVLLLDQKEVWQQQQALLLAHYLECLRLFLRLFGIISRTDKHILVVRLRRH